MSSVYSMSGMPEYMAPEIIMQKNCGPGVDFWCFGSMMHEMVTGGMPFFADNLNLMYESIIKNDFVPDK
jgi:serine/threonine protein kinase